jgi:DNA polymerase I-like protein with 3'-5' exonuclease and polymerase domains
MSTAQNEPSQEHLSHAFQPHPDHADAVNEAIKAIQQLLQEQPGLADVLRTASSTEDVRKELHNHGIEISAEALWRHRGALLKDGQPTWRG